MYESITSAELQPLERLAVWDSFNHATPDMCFESAPQVLGLPFCANSACSVNQHCRNALLPATLHRLSCSSGTLVFSNDGSNTPPKVSR
jgi:hypothetical protein